MTDKFSMISGSNEQLQQQFEYTLLKPDCHSWGISKMQSEREDTLEEWYAIKFRFKLEENVTETYGMLPIAFRPSVRDDEKCGKCKEVNKPELLGHRG